MSSIRLPVIPLLALAAALPVHARQPATQVIQRVEVTADANTVRRNDTAARSTVTRAEIVRYGDASVLDVVRRLPGVTVDGTSIRMRGLGAGYTQVLINGERAPAGFALDSLSPEMIERIDVSRTATADVSTQAIAGSINIILRKSVERSAREVKASLGAGAGQLSPGATVTLTGKSNAMTYNAGANLLINNRDSLATATQETRGSTGALTRSLATDETIRHESAVLNLNARLNWSRPRGDTVSWQSFVNASRSTGGSTERTTERIGPPYLFPLLDAGYNIVNVNGRSDLAWNGKLQGGAQLDTKVGVNIASSRRALQRTGFGQVQVPLLDRIYETDALDYAVSSSGKYAAPIGAGHSMAAGWEVGRNHYSEREVQQDTTLAPIEPFDFDNRFKATISRLAVYVQDEWEISPAWSLYLGARWEQIGIRATAPRVAASTSRSGVLSPLLQSLWKIPGANGSQVRLGVSKTYKAPELRNLVPNHFYTSVNDELTPDYVGNPRLKPELALGLDAAYEYYWAPGAMLSLSVTSRSIDNLIQNEIRREGKRWVSAATNKGKAEVRAFELEIKFPMKAVIKDAPALDVRASASRNWSKVSTIPGPDNHLDRQPRWSANLGADYKRGVVSVGATLALVGAATTRKSGSETRYVSARRELEAYGLYRVNAQEQLRVTMRGLLRTDSIASARYLDAKGSLENVDASEGLIGWRLQYEVKF